MLDYIRQITSDNLFLWCFVSWGCPNFGTLPEFVCFNCWSQLGEQWAVSSLNLARKIDCSASGVPADRIGSGDCQWNKTRNTQRMGALVGLWSLDLFSCEGPAPSCDKIAQRGAESVPRFGFALCREKSGSAEGFMPENVCSVSRCNPRKTYEDLEFGKPVHVNYSKQLTKTCFPKTYSRRTLCLSTQTCSWFDFPTLCRSNLLAKIAGISPIHGGFSEGTWRYLTLKTQALIIWTELG